MAAISLSAWAQDTSASNPPQFEDYPVTEIFKGKPVAPVPATAEQRLYRTRIREGVSMGIGVERDGKEDQPGPNFAGHYIIITFGCGSPCILMAMVDAVTGKVYNSPMAQGLQMSWLDGGPWLPKVEFRQNSRLLIMEPCPNLARGPIYTHYFVCENNRWNLIRKILLQQEPHRP